MYSSDTSTGFTMVGYGLKIIVPFLQTDWVQSVVKP